MRKIIQNKVIEQHSINSLIENGEEIDTRKSTLIANQIFKFSYEIARGDIVVIPSYNSDLVSFGEVLEDAIGDFSQEELRRIESRAILKKRVRWIKDIARQELDPYLYRIFTAHQALNDIGGYAGVVERSLRDFFILDDEAGNRHKLFISVYGGFFYDEFTKKYFQISKEAIDEWIDYWNVIYARLQK